MAVVSAQCRLVLSAHGVLYNTKLGVWSVWNAENPLLAALTAFSHISISIWLALCTTGPEGTDEIQTETEQKEKKKSN